MTSPKVLLKTWKVRPRKSMGQNFLVDPKFAAAIVDRGEIDKNDIVVEIGAGLGAMTVPLSRAAKHVFAVEPDGRIAELLKNELLTGASENVTILQKDILKCDLPSILGPLTDRVRVVGNLPYHISSPVLVYLINNRLFIKSALLMLQKELAERLLAGPGSKSYGRLSILISYCAHARTIVQVPANAFYPRPKVDSTVIEILIRKAPEFPATDERFFFHVVRAAFGKRRKMLKNALKASDLHLSDEVLSQAFEQANITSSRRAETLSLEEFVRLSNFLRPPVVP